MLFVDFWRKSMKNTYQLAVFIRFFLFFESLRGLGVNESGMNLDGSGSDLHESELARAGPHKT